MSFCLLILADAGWYRPSDWESPSVEARLVTRPKNAQTTDLQAHAGQRSASGKLRADKRPAREFGPQDCANVPWAFRRVRSVEGGIVAAGLRRFDLRPDAVAQALSGRTGVRGHSLPLKIASGGPP